MLRVNPGFKQQRSIFWICAAYNLQSNRWARNEFYEKKNNQFSKWNSCLTEKSFFLNVNQIIFWIFSIFGYLKIFFLSNQTEDDLIKRTIDTLFRNEKLFFISPCSWLTCLEKRNSVLLGNFMNHNFISMGNCEAIL